VASGRPQRSTSTIIGVAVLLFGAVLLGVGMHHLVATGTCSSTGYSANFGPVPRCPKGTGWWILFLIGGVFLVIIGGFVARGPSAALIVPAIFGAIGVGSLTVAFQGNVSSGTKTFALIFGGAFALCGLIPALAVIWSGRRSTRQNCQTRRAPQERRVDRGRVQPREGKTTRRAVADKAYRQAEIRALGAARGNPRLVSRRSTRSCCRPEFAVVDGPICPVAVVHDQCEVSRRCARPLGEHVAADVHGAARDRAHRGPRVQRLAARRAVGERLRRTELRCHGRGDHHETCIWEGARPSSSGDATSNTV
jgi:hypothetical protein